MRVKGRATPIEARRPRPVGRARVARLLTANVLVLAGFVTAADAEDRVTVRTPSGIGKAVITGTVLDWTGGVLKIRSGDEVREFEAERVVEVQTRRLDSHLDGLKAFDAGKVDEAARLLNAALGDDPRTWMRREILAALVRVDLARGDRTLAAEHFLTIESSDPTSRHLALIPLDWGTTPPDAITAADARLLLRPGRSDVATLLAASLLLFDEKSGERAAETLGELASDLEPHIYTLARAQLWRKQLADGHVPVGEIERWEDRIHEIPVDLRGGAYALVGRAWSTAGNPERAAAALLWLPLVYDGDPMLAANAAVQAGDKLTHIGRSADAVVLYQEAIARFPSTPAAQDARKRLDALQQAAPVKPATPPAS